ncbi:MAG: SH3 domain-containing protein [Ilumatobacteraceae bacterium]|nr:SH3 domain-containing protein [Ilumatobacteraceae bacterium]
MKPNTCLVVDIWEGQPTIDFVALKAGGVAGIGIRLNDMSGGHHMDQAFTQLWAGAKDFVRFPYFVYNPWVNGPDNFAWLTAHLPAECKSVALDVEVRYSGYPANVYAGEISKFMQLAKIKGLKIIIYTGQGYTSLLSKWPISDFWWAQYPSPANYFAGVKTWDELRVRLDRLDKPFNVAQIPAGGTLKMWQFSGDYLLLPGSNRDMDVNIFYGSEQELADYFGTSAGSAPTPVPVVPTMAYLKPRYIPSGPAIIAASDAPRANHPTISLGDADQAWICTLNNNDPAIWRLFTAPDVGPTKGINSNGRMIYIPAGWSGNVVKIISRAAGWAKVESINLSLPRPIVSHDKTPHLVHRMTTVSVTGAFIGYPPSSPWDKLDDPLLSTDGEFWLPSEWVSEMPTMTTGVNLRSGPGTSFSIVGSQKKGTKVTVFEIRKDANGNTWGRIGDKRWCCLVYAGSAYSDWVLR